MMAINTFSLPDGKMKTRLNIGNVYKKEALFVINAAESPQLQMKARQSRHELNPHPSFISSFLFYFSHLGVSLYFSYFLSYSSLSFLLTISHEWNDDRLQADAPRMERSHPGEKMYSEQENRRKIKEK